MERYYKTSINIPDKKIWEKFKVACILTGKKPTKVLLDLILDFIEKHYREI